MTLGIVTAVRNSMLQAIADAINAGTGAGKLRFYDGSRPSTGGTATNLLAELTLSDPAQTSISSAVLTYDAIASDTNADASGTATWFRIVDSDNNAVYDGSVSTSGADINLDDTAIVAGGTVAMTSLTITAGNA